MFHAAIRFGGVHEIAMMYSAFRISSELPIQESPMPLFWALDSLARRIDNHRDVIKHWYASPLEGPLPSPDKALGILRDAFQAQDQPVAERAAVALSRSIGARQTIELFWKYASRDSDDLGHKAIACAHAWRTLDVVGWEHAEIPLRYVVGRGVRGMDNTFNSCVERVSATLGKLPADWSSEKSDPTAVLELQDEIRNARTNAAADLVCEQLLGDRVKAGSVWDAVHLSAAELLLRNKTRSRGWPVHAVTSSNALHYAFRTMLDQETRLLFLLQAVSRVSDQMTRLALENGDLRDIRIRDLAGDDIPAKSPDAVEAIFRMLPAKKESWEGDATGRDQDEKACRMAFALLSEPGNRPAFIRAACELAGRKSTWNAHDIKFPAAAFEDTGYVSEQWRPHFLAATVHALHGPASADDPVF
ncbi:MAG: hypothetical protein O3A00_25830, partial [Planctomycetota bacterium]|nr:hypothetical protein [Planctomycetota bacterium]